MMMKLRMVQWRERHGCDVLVENSNKAHRLMDISINQIRYYNGFETDKL